MSLFYLFHTFYWQIPSIQKPRLVFAPLIAILALLSGCKTTRSDIVAIPSPADMRSEISVNGRVSTLKHIDIQHVGKQIPLTYSDGKIANSRGYDWWVSKHFALKSDFPEDKVKLYLELLEMSYPHYVELFGMAPAAIDKKRIAVVYGSSRQRTKEAMLDDGFLRGVHKTAGGETMFYNRAGYNFPSHRQHHQRYIVIHETMHAFHMALNGHSTWAPNWITEGMADAIASHVYDPNKKQLTVMVFDRAPMNYLHLGLQQYHQNGQPSFEAINDDPSLKRGLNFFIVHFLLSDPERYQYFKRFIGKLMDANPHSENTLPTANALLKQTFPNWPQLEQQFAAFVRSATPSFYIVDGPWEQNGAAYWFRNTESKTLNRLDIHPNFSSTHAVMDFPTPDKTPLINSLDENSVAALIDFEPEQIRRGEIGFALIADLTNQSLDARLGRSKVEEVDFSKDNLLQFTLQEGVKLTVSSNQALFSSKSIALLPQLRMDIKQYHQLALTLSKQDDALVIKMKTQHHEQLARLQLSQIDISALSLQKISLIGRNNNHRIAPYFAAHDYLITNEQTTNPWHFKDASLLRRAFNTCVEYSAQLNDCMTPLREIFSKQKSRTVTETENKTLNHLMQSWQSTLGDDALFTLSGINTQSYFSDGMHCLYVNNPSTHDIALTYGNYKKILASGEHRVLLPKHTFQNLVISWNGLTQQKPLRTPEKPFDGVKMEVTVRDNITITLTGPYSGASSGILRVDFTPFQSFQNEGSLWQQPVTFLPYQTQVIEVDKLQGLKNGLLEITGEFDVDGEPIRLVKIINL
ncbi:hypothetical protein CTT31_07695 [Pseudoalteromonas maricaloris]|uniref:hypothetical protein n=1 Tax=Pseudoalteromonas maricaloris TaxID=184924 RepID=UPI0021ADE4FC|nr:hypothetical protein [Pseudoalteromonas flavipulchra]USE69001.1 hypothetical protein CTT31_07695 [Pseudoalteromonas flavipulchra]